MADVVIRGIDIPSPGEPCVVVFIHCDGSACWYQDAHILGLMATATPQAHRGAVVYALPDERVVKAKNEGFYGTFYGQVCDPITEDDIHFVGPGASDIGKDGSLWYVWGYPGPDYNRYKVEDYGKTWALTKEELLGQWNGGRPMTAPTGDGEADSSASLRMTRTEGG